MREFLPYLVILALLFLLFQKFQCGESQGVTDTLRVETIIQKEPVYIVVPPTQPIIYPQPLPQVIDTGAILRAFYDRVEYQDTIKSDSVTITLHEFVEKNRITHRTVGFMDLKPRSIITVREYTPVGQLYIGAFANFHGAGPLVSYKTKKDVVFLMGYDPFNKEAMAGAQFKLKLWSSR